MASGADVVGMDSTSAPTRSTSPRYIRLSSAVALVAIVCFFALMWMAWATQHDTTQARQDCIIATGRYAAAGRPSTVTPPSCS